MLILVLAKASKAKNKIRCRCPTFQGQVLDRIGKGGHEISPSPSPGYKRRIQGVEVLSASFLDCLWKEREVLGFHLTTNERGISSGYTENLLYPLKVEDTGAGLCHNF